jgi:hypothetical protein
MTVFSEVKIEDGKIETTKSRVINQWQLSSECWTIQAWGPGKCYACEFLDNEECGGQTIRKTSRNELGYEVPL